MKISKEAIILSCSNRLFIRNGYSETTMRQIASEANVSLGLATYYFRTKRRIAVLVMDAYLRHLGKILYPYIFRNLDPMLYSAAYIRLYIEFFLSHPCKKFYLECLQRDIHMECMEELGDESPYSVAELPYSIAGASDSGMSRDQLLLHSSYLPASAEKLLVLKKENGGFPSISYDDIPYMVFSLSMERIADKALIEKAAETGRVLAEKALGEVAPDITETIFG